MSNLNQQKSHILVIFTATSCGACIKYKKIFRDDVLNKLISEGKVSIIEINFPTFNVVLGPEYHPQLKKYIGWFPEFVLFTNESWYNYSTDLIGYIMGGRIVNGEAKPEKPIAPNAENVSNWINRTIASEMVENIPLSQQSQSNIAMNYGGNRNIDEKKSIVIENKNNTNIQNGNTELRNSKFVPTIGNKIKYKHSELDESFK